MHFFGKIHVHDACKNKLHFTCDAKWQSGNLDALTKLQDERDASGILHNCVLLGRQVVCCM